MLRVRLGALEQHRVHVEVVDEDVADPPVDADDGDDDEGEAGA